MFIDSFSSSVKAEEPRSNNPVIMLSRDGLQALLRQAATWAVANDMTWNVAKCSIICSDSKEGDPLTLAGEVVREVIRAEYLGVSMTVEGITHRHCPSRIS